MVASAAQVRLGTNVEETIHVVFVGHVLEVCQRPR